MDSSPLVSPKTSDNEEEEPNNNIEIEPPIFPKISTKAKIIPRKINNKIANKLPRLSKSGHQKSNSRVYKYKVSLYFYAIIIIYY